MVHTVLHFVTALFIVSTNRDTCNSEEKHGFHTPFFSCLCSVEYSVVFLLEKKRKRKCPARASLRACPFLPLRPPCSRSTSRRGAGCAGARPRWSRTGRPCWEEALTTTTAAGTATEELEAAAAAARRERRRGARRPVLLTRGRNLERKNDEKS